jgi:hypothetical protein
MTGFFKPFKARARLRNVVPKRASVLRYVGAVLLSVLLTTYSFAQTPERDTQARLDSVQGDLSDFEWSSIHTIAGIQYDKSFVKNKLRRPDQKLSVFGYYRLFGYGRNMVESYPNLAPYERAYSIGDGYREPMLSLNVVGRPTTKTTFGTELFMFTPYLGTYQEGNEFTTNLGINFYGNVRTDIGKFGIRAGGIHWYDLSSFTIGLFQVLDRFSIFDRTPWEGVQNTGRYESYFESGSASAGDLRWNNQAFQGLIFNGGSLPGNFAFDVFWGRTQPAAGLPGGALNPFEVPNNLAAGNLPDYRSMAGLARSLPSIVSGGKIQKTFGPKSQRISYNMLRNVASLDSLNNDHRIYQVHTLSLDLDVAGIGITGELGAGSFKSPTYKETWGEALMLRFYLPEKYTVLPVDVQVYQISKDFFNQSGEVFTNSNPEILEEIGLLAGAVGAGGQLAMVNQLVHNRRGVNVNTKYEIGKFKLGVGWGIAQEMDALSSTLNYIHRINGLALSRIYNPFPAGATGPIIFGPYDRLFSYFRGVSEVVQTTDIEPGNASTISRKWFNSLDLTAKYSTKLLNRDLFIFYLGSFSSAEAVASLIPSMHDDSYLFVQYHEFDVYYEIFSDFILTGYFGLENARGGRFTDWDLETLLPRDQLGTAIGVGFDWAVAENSGIYFRYRWMNYKDRSFALDKYRGTELTIELKTFF